MKINNELTKIAYQNIFKSYMQDEFIEIFLDLLDRCEMDFDSDKDLYENVTEAVDRGLIYTDDIWTVYRNYCEMGDDPTELYECIINDLYEVMTEYHAPENA